MNPQLTVLVILNHLEFRGEARQGLDDRIELAGGLQVIQTTQCRNDSLMRPASFPVILYELQILSILNALNAGKHITMTISNNAGLSRKTAGYGQFRGTMRTRSRKPPM